MKIERFFLGLIEDKVTLLASPGLTKLLHDKTFQRLRDLCLADSGKYLWLPTEQTVALPILAKVWDKYGREYVQNYTRLIRIHDYLQIANPLSILERCNQPFDLSVPFEALEVNP